MKKYVLFFLLISPWTLLASFQEFSPVFFDHLKNLEFAKAMRASAELKDDKLSFEFYQLAEVLYYEGQKDQSYFLKDLNYEKKEMDSHNEMNIVKLLKGGYLDLFYNSGEGNAYRKFYEAYSLAKDLDKSYLIRACLLALLKYYNYEIAQNSEAYKPYLEHLAKISNDRTDEIWVTIYKMIFYSKTLQKFDNQYFEIGKNLKQYEIELDKNSPLLANILYEQAMMFDLDGRVEEAKEQYKRAMLSSRNYPFLKSIRFFSLIKLAMIGIKSKDFIASNNFLESAAKQFNIADTLRSRYYLNLNTSFYYRAKDSENVAYDYLLSAYRQDFEMDFRTNTLEVSRLNVELETQEKEKQILQEQQRTKQNRNLLIVSIIALLLVSIIAILFQKNTSKRRKLAEQQEQIQIQKVETLLKKQELTSIDAMIEGQEKERARMANELHDDLGSLMATVKLHFSNIKTDKEDNAIKKASALLDQAYEKIRDIAHTKNSGVIANHGLVPAVQKMAQVISETNTIHLEVHDFGMEERMENSLELTLFRIIQELVTNTIKHAKATQGSIQLTQHEDNLNIIVEDNGKGFDMSSIERHKSGMGLGTIEKRVENLEGTFTVDSILGKGTSIVIDIPI